MVKRIKKVRSLDGYNFLTKATCLVILLVLSSYFMFFNLGASSLKGGEATHAIVSKHVAETDRLYPLYITSLDPRVETKYYCMKPPLKVWTEALAFSLLSTSEFSARVVDAIFGVLTILLVYIMASLIFDNFQIGFLASLLTLAFPPLVISHCFRHGNQDSALVFFYTAAILFYLFYKKRNSSVSFCISVASMVLGLLVKDAFLLFFGFSAILGEFLILTRNTRSIFTTKNVALVAIPLFSYTSYKIYSGIATHGVCLSRFFKPPFILSLGEHKPRYIKGLTYYLNILYKLYGVFFLVTFVAMLKKYVTRFMGSHGDGTEERSNLDWNLALFTLFICLLYVMSISIPIYKVKRYLYPVIPGLAVSMSFFIWTFIRSIKNTKAKIFFILVLVAFVAWPLEYTNSKIRKVKVAPYHALMMHYNDLAGNKAFLGDLSRSAVFGTYATFYFSRLSTPMSWYEEPRLLSYLENFRGRAFVVVSEPKPMLRLFKERGYTLMKVWPLKHRKKQIPRNFVIEVKVSGAGGEAS